MTLLCDLHIHSCFSPDGYHTPEKLAEAAKKCGLHAIAICDHDCSTPLPQTDGITLISGTEITTEMGHVLGLFLQSPCNHDALGKLPSVDAAVQEIHRCGGLAVLAHPYAPNKAPDDILAALPVDGIETVNARSALYRGANEKASALAASMGVFCTGGSDGHHRKELCSAVTEIDACDCTPDALRDALLRGRCRAKLLRTCKWRYKALSMVKKNFADGTLRQKCHALCYFLASIFRDLVNYRR